jgi:O-antigen ligase
VSPVVSEARLYQLSWGVFLLLFLRPYPVQLIGRGGVRFIDVAMVALVLVPPFLAGRLRADARMGSLVFLLFGLTTVALLSATLSTVIGLTTASPRDIFESMRYLGLAAYLLFGFYLARHPRFEGWHFVAASSLILMLALGFSLLQKFFPQATLGLTKLYAPEHQSGRVFLTKRVLAFFGNPNTNGFMTLNLLLAPLAFAFTHQTSRVFRIFVLALVPLCLFVIIQTGSRTAFVTLLAILALVPLLMQRYKIVLGASLAIVAVFVLRDPVLTFVKAQSDYFANGLRSILFLDFEKLTTQGTFAKRLDHWREALRFFQEAPLLGAGPLRARIGSATDNFYIYILARYGIVGLAIFVLIWTRTFGWGIEAYRGGKSTLRFLGLYVLALLVSFSVANLSIEAQIIPVPASLFFVSAGLLLGCMSREKEASHG